MHASIAFNRSVSAQYRHLGIASPGFAADPQAGRFVMVRPPRVGDPFLPRAFSIYRVSRMADATPVIEVLYKILGKGTQYLSTLESGQELEILGPLGNSFTPPPPDRTAVLVAGGIGVPPIAAFATQIRNSKFEIRNWEVFLGGKTAEDILCLDDFQELGLNPRITTEDGSLGTRGFITDLLGPLLASTPTPPPHPPPPALL